MVITYRSCLRDVDRDHCAGQSCNHVLSRYVNMCRLSPLTHSGAHNEPAHQEELLIAGHPHHHTARGEDGTGRQDGDLTTQVSTHWCNTSYGHLPAQHLAGDPGQEGEHCRGPDGDGHDNLVPEISLRLTQARQQPEVSH